MQSEELIKRVLAFVPAIYLMGECLYSLYKIKSSGGSISCLLLGRIFGAHF